MTGRSQLDEILECTDADGYSPPREGEQSFCIARDGDLVRYVMDLEALVRWLALTFSWRDQEGEVHINDPIWSAFNEYGHPLGDTEKLERTWKAVMHPELDYE